MKKLSVVILNYNSLDMIKDCLESFEKYQPRIDYEIIIANNDDNTQDFERFAKNYPEIKFIQNTGNWGFSSGCNLGVSIAEGEYLLFLNPDTELNKTPAIDKMVELLEVDQSVGICGCKIIDSNGGENILSWNNPWFFIKWIKAIHDLIYKDEVSKMLSNRDNIWYPNIISGAILAIKTDDFKKLGGWGDDKYWMYSEDRDLCNMMSKTLNKRLAQLRDCNIYHIWGGTSDKGSSLMLNMEMTISRHNYIYHNKDGIQRATLLTLYIIKNLTTPIIKLVLNILLLNRKNIEKYKYITIETIRYYLKSIKRKTWKSDKLEYEKR
jgi:GT2 family glycosyltransferase